MDNEKFPQKNIVARIRDILESEREKHLEKNDTTPLIRNTEGVEKVIELLRSKFKD